MFWNKPLLKWREPRFAENFIAKQLRFKDYILVLGKRCLIISILAYTGIVFLRWYSPRKLLSFFDFELFGAVLFFVTGYLFLWLVAFLVSKKKPQISFYDKGISIVAFIGGEYTSYFVGYKELKSFSIIKTNIEDNEFFVLVLKNWDDKEEFIEIDPKIDKESIAEILGSKNVQLKTLSANPYLKVDSLLQNNLN